MRLNNRTVVVFHTRNEGVSLTRGEFEMTVRQWSLTLRLEFLRRGPRPSFLMLGLPILTLGIVCCRDVSGYTDDNLTTVAMSSLANRIWLTRRRS